MLPHVSAWQQPPQRPNLPERHLHLWRFSLNSSSLALDTGAAFLSPAERLRAARLLDPWKKAQFIIARANLKRILAAYLETQAEQVCFRTNEHGKPFLDESHSSRLSFNLSHSGRWGTLALLKDISVGVDIEYIETSLDYCRLAAHYFDVEEQRRLSRYPEGKRRRGFYRLWTRKEAVLKLSGRGFQQSSQSVAPPKFLYNFLVARGYVAAVATVSGVDSVDKFSLSD